MLRELDLPRGRDSWPLTKRSTSSGEENKIKQKHTRDQRGVKFRVFTMIKKWDLEYIVRLQSLVSSRCREVGSWDVLPLSNLLRLNMTGTKKVIVVCVLQNKLNLVVSPGCMLWRGCQRNVPRFITHRCRTTVPVIKSFVWRSSRCRRRRSLLKLPNCTRITYKGVKLLMASFSIFLS